jgi:hypothetical protein
LLVPIPKLPPAAILALSAAVVLNTIGAASFVSKRKVPVPLVVIVLVVLAPPLPLINLRP